MSRIFCQNSPKVKPTRRTPRPESRFGAGILRWTPAPVAYGFVPLPEDEAAAAQMFGASESDFDRLAAESLAVDQLSRGYFLG